MAGTTEKFSFRNPNGETLFGSLELPEGTIRATALFAHCFSCNRNILAASRISRALREHGFAVLRFDFTGLGQSEGDFANTNFSTNLDDLRAAVTALQDRGMDPSILVGHSLGGAAVLYLAGELSGVSVVATIGAPSEPAHVARHFDEEQLSRIEETGEATVDIGGRTFTVKKQFIKDIQEASLTQRLGELRKPILICHSPTDSVVEIDQARKIYEAAKHPKSFVSLDGADHLLSGKADAQFVANLIATWAERYIALEVEPSAGGAESIPHGSVRVRERNASFTQDITAGPHSIVADEPENVGGDDLGMTPYDLLLASLGACTSMTLRMYAKRKQIDLKKVQVTLQHDRIHSDDCNACEEQANKVDRIRRVVELQGDLTAEQRKRMLEIADMCPVHRTLMNQKEILTEEG